MNAKNTLFIVSGMPAVGKTTFARQLARQTRACLVDIDVATETVVQAAMGKLTGDPNDRDSPTFKATFRQAIYATLFALADDNLAHTDVVLTGPFTQEFVNENWPRDAAAALKTPCTTSCVFLHCDPELRKRRLIERGNPRDAAKIENWEEHLSYYNTPSRPAYSHIAVDTGDPKAVERALNELAAR